MRFVLVDVFTDRAFGGNPLAVFPDAASLPDRLMARIANELNLSETAFVVPARDPEATHRLRIFTPRVELPFAGHPTIGAACVLASAAHPEADGRMLLVFEESAGRIEVTVERGPPHARGRLRSARLPESGPPAPDSPLLARLLGIESGDILDGDEHRAEALSCGVPFLFVPVRDVGALERSRLDPVAWSRELADAWAPHVYVFAPDPGIPGIDVRARMFAPAMGIEEDPATGAAASALAGYLDARSRSKPEAESWTIEQGVEMGRPGLIEVSVTRSAGLLEAVYVAGGCVPIAEASLDPAALSDG